jgi:hypothetical protein
VLGQDLSWPRGGRLVLNGSIAWLSLVGGLSFCLTAFSFGAFHVIKVNNKRNGRKPNYSGQKRLEVSGARLGIGRALPCFSCQRTRMLGWTMHGISWFPPRPRRLRLLMLWRAVMNEGGPPKTLLVLTRAWAMQIGYRSEIGSLVDGMEVQLVGMSRWMPLQKDKHSEGLELNTARLVFGTWLRYSGVRTSVVRRGTPLIVEIHQ